MPTHFSTGSLWSDGAIPPAAKALTTSYVVGDEIYLDAESELTIVSQISGTTPTSVQLQLEQSMDGVQWAVVDLLPDHGLLPGTVATHCSQVALTKWAYYRLSALRTGGAVDTALLALGWARHFGGRDE